MLVASQVDSHCQQGGRPYLIVCSFREETPFMAPSLFYANANKGHRIALLIGPETEAVFRE